MVLENADAMEIPVDDGSPNKDVKNKFEHPQYESQRDLLEAVVNLADRSGDKVIVVPLELEEDKTYTHETVVISEPNDTKMTRSLYGTDGEIIRDEGEGNGRVQVIKNPSIVVISQEEENYKLTRTHPYKELNYTIRTSNPEETSRLLSEIRGEVKK